MSLSDLFSRRRKDEADAVDAGADSPVYATKALAKFLTGLNGRSQPLILDLGPVVGANVNFFGQELGCKILVGNLTEDIDRYHKEGKTQQLPAFFDKRFDQGENTIDGILAWDSFFHLCPDDQRRMFPIFRQHAASRAALMFTSGPAHGEAIGSYKGEPLYHASLDAAEYRALLNANGFDVAAHMVEDPDCGNHTIWLAQLT